jgi:Reverse transcriptase (RNA-dependent DNA polymerase)
MLPVRLSVALPPPCAGRLQSPQFREAWRRLRPNDFLMKLLSKGFKPKIRGPVPKPRPYPSFQVDRNDAEQCKWKENLFAWGAIEPAQHERGEILHRLTAAKSGRICSDIRQLNAVSKLMPCHMDNLKALRQQWNKNEWFLKLDLAKYYWSCQIHPKYRKWFRFSMDHKLWQWKVLPFGFKNSLGIMSQFMSLAIQALRKLDIQVASWVDDLILMLGYDYQVAMKKAQEAINLIQALGWIINVEKSTMTPVKRALFRGFLWDTESYVILVPPEKGRDINMAARAALTCRYHTPRSLAKITGKIRYIAQIFPHLTAYIVELELAKKQALRAGRANWDFRVKLPPLATAELRSIAALDLNLSTPIRLDLSACHVIKGDAGPYGYGICAPNLQIAGKWDANIVPTSTNYRELLTWSIQVQEIQQKPGSVSIYETDSTVALAYMNKVYGKCATLSRLAKATVLNLLQRGALQVGRLANQVQIAEADQLSRLSDKWDSQLNHATFTELCRKWSFQPTVDLFASRFSTKCPRFFARAKDPKALGVDALKYEWRGERAYAFPPTRKIHETINKARGEGVPLLLIVPDQPKAPWFQTCKRWSRKHKVLRPNLFTFPTGKHALKYHAFLLPHCRDSLQGRWH